MKETLPSRPAPNKATTDASGHRVTRRQYSLAEIANAASLVLNVRADHPAIAQLAGRLRNEVNEAGRFPEGLKGAGFHSLVTSNLSPAVLAVIDRAKTARQHANAGSLDAPRSSRGYNILGGPQAQARAGSSSGEHSGATQRDGDSEQYDEAVRVAQTTAGMAWVLGNRDLLALGPEAIRTIADSGISKGNYIRFTAHAGFAHRDAVDILRNFERDGLTPEQVNEQAARTSDVLELVQKHKPADAPHIRELYKEFTAVPATDKKLKQEKWNALQGAVDKDLRDHPDALGTVEPWERTQEQVFGVETKRAGDWQSSESLQSQTKIAKADKRQAKAELAGDLSLNQAALTASATPTNSNQTQMSAQQSKSSRSPAAASPGPSP